MAIMNVMLAYRKSAALHTFVQSRAPYFIGLNGAMTLSELSYLCEVDSDRFSRVLDIMIGLDILTYNDNYYQLTPESAALADEESLESLNIKFECGEYSWKMWPKYVQSLNINSTLSAFEHENGCLFFDFLNSNADIKSTFDKLMTKMTEEISEEIVNFFDDDNTKRVVDIGGGKGILAQKLISDGKAKACTVLDVFEEDICHLNGVTFINGDFFQKIPPGEDIYLLKNIIHNWNDDNATKIIKNCAEAMKSDSVLYIIEIIKDRSKVNKGETLDMLMDAFFLGKEREIREYKDLARVCGLKIDGVFATSFPQSIIMMSKV